MKKNLKIDFRNKKSRRRFAILVRTLAVFGVVALANTYAWFVFFTKTSTSIQASVMSWDINFTKDNEEIKELVLDIDMKPGMDPYEKRLVITNSGEIAADYNVIMKEFSILNSTYTVPTDISESDSLDKLKYDYPFHVLFTPTTAVINPGNTLVVSIQANWPYESTNPYYKLTNDFLYDSQLGYEYYLKQGDLYRPVVVSALNFSSLIDSGLYVESDDADSYYGNKCGTIQNNGESCVKIRLQLEVTQKQ